MTALTGVEFVIPIRTVNELNQKVHWGEIASRRKAQRAATILAVKGLKSQWMSVKSWGAWIVTLCRVSARELDSHDGLRASMKAIVDQLAVELGLPASAPYYNKKAGKWIAGNANDKDPRVSWEYSQDFGPGRIPSVRVWITGRRDAVI